MLYKLGKTDDKFSSVEPMPFEGLPKEKELEELLAENLWDILFEGNELMPISQERSWQPEADIYALNRHGDLVIFELKRDFADSGAVHQLLRYCEKAAHFGYGKLEEIFRKYSKKDKADLREQHQADFDLEHPLDKSSFNTRQHLIVVGNAGDEELIHNVDYWKSRGLLLDFIPYRVYRIKGELYFEFFSLPYDRHANPGYTKGVIFDTNLSYDKDSIWYMCDNNRVAAFGDQSHVVNYLNKKDIVFLYQKGAGIIAAGIVTSAVKADTVRDASYRDLKWLTSIPRKGSGDLKAMLPGKIKDILERDFFWARTIKSPYLSKEESDKLLKALIDHIGPKS
ncbi:MAG: hypothetical protein AB1442_05005 [Nitrospirota bacterium]